jgi:hypothetical protein
MQDKIKNTKEKIMYIRWYWGSFGRMFELPHDKKTYGMGVFDG